MILFCSAWLQVLTTCNMATACGLLTALPSIVHDNPVCSSAEPCYMNSMQWPLCHVWQPYAAPCRPDEGYHYNRSWHGAVWGCAVQPKKPSWDRPWPIGRHPILVVWLHGTTKGEAAAGQGLSHIGLYKLCNKPCASHQSSPAMYFDSQLKVVLHTACI